MAGVLSKPATRLAAAAAARPASGPASIFLTVTRRPSAFASPHAAIPRFIHSKVTPDPRLELTPEVKAEITRMVREAVQAETMGIKATCLERYEKLSTDQISQGEVSAESMLESIRSQKRLGHIGFSVWVSVVGLSAAAQYKAEISKFIMGNGPSSEEEVDKMVDDKVKAYTDSVVRQEVRSVCAEHFQKEQSIKDPQKKDS